MTEQTELAWIAGFLDGEGCFTLTSKGSGNGVKRYLRISVNQTDPQPLQRIATVAGVKVGGPYKPRSALSRKPIYIVSIQGKKAHALLELIWPYMSQPKRKQARDAVTRVNGGVD